MDWSLEKDHRVPALADGHAKWHPKNTLQAGTGLRNDALGAD